MVLDQVTLHRLWNETNTRLDSLIRQVREGAGVVEASNFSRWLRFSGILQILQEADQEVPLPIRGHELTRKCVGLQSDCGEWFSLHEKSNRPRDAYISQAKLDSIDEQMKLIREELAVLRSERSNILPMTGGVA